jgi:hypothetical protein
METNIINRIAALDAETRARVLEAVIMQVRAGFCFTVCNSLVHGFS